VLRGTKTLRWSGSDPDKDTLSYEAQLSSDGGKTWLPVRSSGGAPAGRSTVSVEASAADTEAQVYVLLGLGNIMGFQGRWQEGIRNYEAALALCGDGLLRLRGQITCNLAVMHREQGDLSESAARLEAASALWTAMTPADHSVWYNSRGLLALARGESDTAETNFRQALETAGSDFDRAMGLDNLAEVLGQDPIPLFRDFAVSVYTDDAVAGVPAIFTQPSWNHRALAQAISNGYPLKVRPLSSGSEQSFSLTAGGAAYRRARRPQSRLRPDSRVARIQRWSESRGPRGSGRGWGLPALVLFAI
jgi:tetratricopeptide (TPR) repeat protein